MYPGHRGEAKRKTILKGIEKYPHSFHLLRDIRVTRPAFQNVHNHLEAGQKAGYTTSLQTAAAGNLLAFALFQLEKHEEALEESEKVLQMEDQKSNIVCLANKVHMLSMLSLFGEAEEALGELTELEGTPEMGYLLIKAKAELAASYLRFGPRFNKHAIDGFKEVIPQAKEPEVWMWKFSLAVAYRHALDLQHAPYVSLGEYKVTHKDTLKLFKEIIASTAFAGEEIAHNNLKANAYAEMGLLLRLAWDKTTEFQLSSQVQAGPLACCKKALALDNNDASVLRKSGNLYRACKDMAEAKRLLEKAVQQQPSSAAYHHLGLLYKALASNPQCGKKRTRRGGKREKRRKQAMATYAKHTKVESCSVPAGENNTDHRRWCGSSRPTPHATLVDRIKKVVKSPDSVTHFDPQEENTKQAIKNLRTAVEFSAGENSRAAYDLALMLAGTESLDEALKTFQKIVRRRNNDLFTPSGLLECVTSLEQMGLIYKLKSEKERNEREKVKLIANYEQKLHEALSMASELFSTTPILRNIGEFFQAPTALLQAAEAADCSEDQKKKEKTNILSLMNRHKESLAVLRDIGKEAHDARYYQLKIQTLARNGEYETAVVTLSCLKPTEQHEEVMKLLEKEDGAHAVFNIYLEAGREALLDGKRGPGYLSTAFRQAVKPADQEVGDSPGPSAGDPAAVQGAAATANTGCGEAEGLYDIMLLHDEDDDDIEDKAERLRYFLETACGLKVVQGDEHSPLGTQQRRAFEKNITNSRLVVILPGKEPRMEEFEDFVSIAVRKEFVVLLAGDVGPEFIPEQLKTSRLRYTRCPDELIAPEAGAAGAYSVEEVNSICSLFKFLAIRND